MNCNTLAESKKIVQSIKNYVSNTLIEGDSFIFWGLGQLSTYERASTVRSHPKTQKKIRVSKKRWVKFKLSNSMKKKL